MSEPEHPAIVATPVYRQLADLMRRMMANGEIASGERAPSERELAERYQVSRATANKVLSSLVSEGLLEQRKGIGTFVRERGSLRQSLRKMKSFTEQARAHGRSPSTEVLSFKRVAARTLGARLRQELRLDASATVIVVERLRRLDGEAVILETRWIPALIVPGLKAEDLAGSFYQLLEERHKICIEAEDHVVSAVNLDPATAARLEVPAGHAALDVRSTGFDNDSRGKRRPIWHHHLHMRGDRYTLQNNCLHEGHRVRNDLRFLQNVTP